MMLLIEERDNDGRSIQQILKDAYAQHGSQRSAGAAIGITGAAFNQWIHRFGIDLTEREEGGEAERQTA